MEQASAININENDMNVEWDVRWCNHAILEPNEIQIRTFAQSIWLVEKLSNRREEICGGYRFEQIIFRSQFLPESTASEFDFIYQFINHVIHSSGIHHWII